MGTCRYCGKPAGFLRTQHKECRRAFETGAAEIVGLVAKSLSDPVEPQMLVSQAKRIAERSFIDQNTLSATLREAWFKAIDRAFEDGILTQQEEDCLASMMDTFGLDRKALSDHPSYQRLVKGAVLRDVLEGKITERVSITGSLPFNFIKNEKLAWVFQNVPYHEMRTTTRYVGGSHGMSIRIMRGVYYRVGAFRGRPVQQSEMAHVDTGIMAVTDAHIYFGGALKSFRIPYEKIVSFQPYEDGIGIQRDAQTAKPQVFVTGDGWFTYNLITNLAKAGRN